MPRVALGLLLGMLTAGTATAGDAVSPATDRLLWCGSAFYWLSTDAYDLGDSTEAAQYEAWSDELGERADLMLQSEGLGEDEIVAIRDDYDTRVVAEMGKPEATYDVTTCPDLVAQ